MGSPLLSIIVPCHNVYSKVQPLLTALNELNRDDVEVIFVDDCSTDNTSAILVDFKQSSPLRVKVLRGDYRGPGGARNAGLQAARAHYVWLVDADDKIYPAPVLNCLDNLVSNHDIDIVAFRVREAERPDSHAQFGSESQLKNWIQFGRIGGKIIKKSIVPMPLYPELVFNGEDNLATLLLSMNVRTYMVSDDTVYEAVAAPDSLTRGEFKRRYLLRWKAGEEILKVARNRAHKREIEGFKRQAVLATIDSTWSYYIHHGRLRDLLLLLPRLLAVLRHLGIISHLDIFLANGSFKNRLVKRVAVWSMLPVSYFHHCTVDDLVADIASETLRQRTKICPPRSVAGYEI